MQRLIKNRMLYRANGGLPRLRGRFLSCLWVPLFATVIMAVLSGCGGGASGGSQQSAAVSGNWQFSMTNPAAPTGTQYGLQGGFLLQANGSVTGQGVYSISNVQDNQTVVCNSGTATMTGTVSGQTVSLTAVAGDPSNNTTFLLTGTLASNANGPTLTGDSTKSSSTVSTPSGSTACDIAQPNLSWSATSVPPLTGSITGSFHSGGGTGNSSGLVNQDFPVTGALTQGANIGASNATVTGTLSFVDPATGLSDYPCFPGGTVSVSGEISGNTVIFQLIGTDGSNAGQIGVPASEENFGGDDMYPVIFDSTTNELHSTTGLAYVVNTKSCPANPPSAGREDFGYICLAMNSTTACQEPITLSPVTVTFPAQTLGASQRQRQVITLENNTNSTLSGLTAGFTYNGDAPEFGSGYTDFNGLPSFQAQDTCVPGGEILSPSGTPGAQFTLAPGGSCSIAVNFTPQESCPWLPFPQSGVGQSIAGASPEYCPLPQSALLTVNSPASADSDQAFVVPITGAGLSAIQPSTPELDFGAEEQFSPPEASLPQTLSLTNYSAYPVQILGSVPCVDPWTLNSQGREVEALLTLPRPLSPSSEVPGLQVVVPGMAADPTTPPTVTYSCDSDFATSEPSFQISSDTCTGTVLASQGSCSVQITYVPQPNAPQPNSGGIPSGGLDYFLELNTEQCWPAGTTPSASNPCELDSGRFPVELKANGPSPLRMSPGAGLDFGGQKKGTTSVPLTITLFNDPSLTTTQAVTFVGKIQVSGSYSESDDCPVTLNPGASCTLTVIFKPGSVGFLPGNLTINYTPEPSGKPQTVYLRGTGQ